MTMMTQPDAGDDGNGDDGGSLADAVAEEMQRHSDALGQIMIDHGVAPEGDEGD
jgi:hypothetical protein